MTPCMSAVWRSGPVAVPGPEGAAGFQNTHGSTPPRITGVGGCLWALRFVIDGTIGRIPCFEKLVASLKQTTKGLGRTHAACPRTLPTPVCGDLVVSWCLPSEPCGQHSALQWDRAPSSVGCDVPRGRGLAQPGTERAEPRAACSKGSADFPPGLLGNPGLRVSMGGPARPLV